MVKGKFGKTSESLKILWQRLCSYWWKEKRTKRYEKIWKKIKDIIRLTSNSSGNYDKIYMKIRFNSDDNDLPLKKKTLELYRIIIVVRSVLYEYSK